MLITNYMRQSDYDGIHLIADGKSNGVMVESYIVFEPNQIKSATDNIGTFDGSNPDIRYSIAEDMSEQTMYSGIKNSSLATATDVQAPVLTSETTSSTATDTTISQNDTDVNGSIREKGGNNTNFLSPKYAKSTILMT